MPGAWPLIKLAPSRQIHITATTLRTYKLFGPHNEGGGNGLDPFAVAAAVVGFICDERRSLRNTWVCRDNLTLRRNFKTHLSTNPLAARCSVLQLGYYVTKVRQ